MRTPDGSVVPETIAIAEELATRHPDAGLWPADPHARATARVLAAEMHAGFTALAQPLPDEPARQLHRLPAARGCAEGPRPPRNPLGLGARRRPAPPPPGSAAPIPPPMPSSPPSPPASPPTTCPSARRRMLYVNAHLAHPSFRRWRAMGMVDGADQDFYRRDYPRRDWPGPVRLPATRRRRHRQPKTPPAPIPASPSPTRWNFTAAASASATPSAATRPWPTPRPGRSSWPFTTRKPFRPTR